MFVGDVEQQLGNLPVKIPIDDAHRGIMIVLDQSTHAHVFARLQGKGAARFRINLPKPGTSAADNPLVGYPEFHLSRVR